METIKVKKIREPKLSDILAVRHGRYIQRDVGRSKNISGFFEVNLESLSISWRKYLNKKAIN